MPERVYMNRIDGQRRIHVEIAESEIDDLLDDLPEPGDACDATKALHAILTAAQRDFGRCRRRDAHEGEVPR